MKFYQTVQSVTHSKIMNFNIFDNVFILDVSLDAMYLYNMQQFF